MKREKKMKVSCFETLTIVEFVSMFYLILHDFYESSSMAWGS